jgi:biofilm protein TabA
MALYGSFETIRAQALPTPGFAIAFAYLTELLRADSAARQRIRAISPGEAKKIDLGSGVYAVEQVYETKPRADGFFESHRKYIDVQALVEGEELIEVADLARMKIREPFSEERDLVLYTDAVDASQLRLFAGQVAIFYPVDVHMPTLRLGAGPTLVRKSVVKVPVG